MVEGVIADRPSLRLDGRPWVAGAERVRRELRFLPTRRYSLERGSPQSSLRSRSGTPSEPRTLVFINLPKGTSAFLLDHLHKPHPGSKVAIRLVKALYGLKQSPAPWNAKVGAFMKTQQYQPLAGQTLPPPWAIWPGEIAGCLAGQSALSWPFKLQSQHGSRSFPPGSPIHVESPPSAAKLGSFVPSGGGGGS